MSAVSPCRCHAGPLYASLETCPECGHRSLDVVGGWAGCERRACAYERNAGVEVLEAGCGCCGDDLEEPDAEWCERCAAHVGAAGAPWDRTYRARHGVECPYQVGAS